MSIVLRFAPRLAALALALLLAACAATTDLLNVVEETPPTQAAHSLIVVGNTPDDAARARYERVFVIELQHAGIAGIPSSSLIPSVQGLSAKELHDRMLQYTDRAELVIHVQLVSLVQTRTWSPTDYARDGKPATAEIAGVPVTINAPQDPVGAQTEVELQANLYQTATRKLLWTATSRTHEANSFESVARSHARALIRELVARGYLHAH